MTNSPPRRPGRPSTNDHAVRYTRCRSFPSLLPLPFLPFLPFLSILSFIPFRPFLPFLPPFPSSPSYPSFPFLPFTSLHPLPSFPSSFPPLPSEFTLPFHFSLTQLSYIYCCLFFPPSSPSFLDSSLPSSLCLQIHPFFISLFLSIPPSCLQISPNQLIPSFFLFTSLLFFLLFSPSIYLSLSAWLFWWYGGVAVWLCCGIVAWL